MISRNGGKNRRDVFAFGIVAVWILVALMYGCTWPGRGKPSWIDGASTQFPAEQYLLGVGQADSQPAATERAYGAVAKIFKAEVHAQSQDWESFLLLEKRGQASSERRLTLDQITKVSSDKVLENVRVLDTWYERNTGLHYALAGMDRAQAGAALLERITELDRSVETELAEARGTPDKLAKVRNLRRAVKNLILREAYNTDLRVIRLNGQGSDPPYRVAELTTELERFLADRLVVGVEVVGEQAEVTRRAVMEGLIREGLPVTERAAGTQTGSNEEGTEKAPELLVKGAVQLRDVAVPDPRFRYARWCGDFVVIELGTQRIVGTVSISGREGHLTASEARAKAIRIMQQELTSNLAKTIAAYVYGETDPPATLPPSACQKKEEPISPPSGVRPL